MTYEDLQRENAMLRAKIAELEAVDAARLASSADLALPPERFKPHEMDPNAADAFRRPAYSSRRTT